MSLERGLRLIDRIALNKPRAKPSDRDAVSNQIRQHEIMMPCAVDIISRHIGESLDS